MTDKPKFSFEWGDPAMVAEIHERQDRSGCKGCIHRVVLWEVQACAKQPGIAGKQMARCGKFQRRSINGNKR